MPGPPVQDLTSGWKQQEEETIWSEACRKKMIRVWPKRFLTVLLWEEKTRRQSRGKSYFRFSLCPQTPIINGPPLNLTGKFSRINISRFCQHHDWGILMDKKIKVLATSQLSYLIFNGSIQGIHSVFIWWSELNHILKIIVSHDKVCFNRASHIHCLIDIYRVRLC